MCDIIAVFTPQDFKSMFGHFSKLCNKGLKIFMFCQREMKKLL